MSYHSKKSWRQERYFQSAHIGQEFIIEDNENVENWAKSLIEKFSVQSQSPEKDCNCLIK